MSRETKARPTIKPIQTNHPPFEPVGPSNRVLASFNSPVCSASPISPGTVTRPLYPNVHDRGLKLREKVAVDSLDNKSRTSSRKELTISPLLLRPIRDPSIRTPPTAVSEHFPLSAPIVESTAGRRQTFAPETNDIIPSRDGNLASPSGVHLLARRQSAPPGAAAFRHLRFQRFREDLWRQGRRTFGNASRADVFVIPMDLRRPFMTPTSATGATILANSDRLTVRAVIYSKSHSPIALTRNFDLGVLRATIPEPLPSPCTPHFDHGVSPTVHAARSGIPSTSPPALVDTKGDPVTPTHGSEKVRTPTTAGTGRSRVRPVPIGKQSWWYPRCCGVSGY